MSTPVLHALRRNLVLFTLAFALASAAFGMTMLSSPPTSKAAVSTLADDGRITPVTNCEFLPLGDSNRCTVYR